MARTPKPKNAVEDEAQSKRFLELAKELEADGGRSLTEAARRFDRLIGKALPRRTRRQSTDGE